MYAEHRLGPAHLLSEASLDAGYEAGEAAIIVQRAPEVSA